MDNSEVMDSIIEEYEKLRAENKSRRDSEVERVYTELPIIKEIDDKISEIGSETLKKILTNPDAKGLKEEMHNKFEILKQQRKEILVKNSIPLDFDKVKYRCEKCHDTGYIEDEGRCSCFSQKLLDYTYKQSRMGELLKNQNFDSFRLDYYSKSPVKGLKFSPYENMEKILTYCRNYVENFDNMNKSLCFYGDTGLGKTFMSCCIAKDLMDRGKTVLYMRAAKLFRMFDDEKFGRNTDGLNELYDCDMLIIDDLGTETDSKFNSSYLLELINERIINNKNIVLNTNLNFKGMEEKYTKRFSSRLTESFIVMYFYGEDIRRKKFNEK